MVLEYGKIFCTRRNDTIRATGSSSSLSLPAPHRKIRPSEERGIYRSRESYVNVILFSNPSIINLVY